MNPGQELFPFAPPAAPEAPEVSPTMQAAIDYARRLGGRLARFPGGFWMAADGRGKTFGTSTIEALVRRGLADYTKHRDGARGRFPVEVSLK